MRLTLSLLVLLGSLSASGRLHAQGVNAPPGAYEELPIGSAPPASDEGLTIVPPMNPPSIADSVVVETQPWTSEVSSETQHVPMTHAISAEPWDSNWFGTVELTLLRPYHNDLPVANRHLSVGPRLTLGWESDRGFGLRGRFWGMENESDLLGPGGLTAEMRLQTFRFDMDFYREFDFRGSSIIVGASVSAAEIEGEIDGTGPVQDDGGGVGLFVEGRHLLTRSRESEWAVLARGRWAGLVGTWEDPNSPLFTTSGDSNMQIVEAGFGWEYKRKFESCSLVFQHQIELQTWDASYVGEVSLFGQSLTAGFTY
jgi:hypothetical protein